MKKYYLILFLFLLSCNSEEPPFPRCIAADDFNTLGITIGANVPKGSELFKSEKSNETSDGFNADQVVRWQKTGFVTNGEPLVIRTQGMWSAWLDDGNKTSTTASKVHDKFKTKTKYDQNIKLSSISQDRICGPYPEKDPGGKCGSQRKCPYIELNNPKDNKDKKQYGPPCWFRDGYGAYILLKRPTDQQGPNDTLDVMRNPVSPVVHIGYDRSKGERSYLSINHPFLDANCAVIDIEAGWEVYVKILDRFYWNDAGGYAFEFIKGVEQIEKIRVLESIRVAVKEVLIDNGAGQIFKRLTQNNVYIDFVKALLALYIAFTGIAFMFGMVQQAYSDVVIRIIKIAIVMQLISPSSWDFFYNNLAILFIDGTTHVIGIINNFSGHDFDVDKPFAAFDLMLDTLFSGTVWRAKAIAYTWTNPGFISWLVVLMVIIIIISYVVVMIRACVVYLINMIGLSILIALLPLFLLAILFAKLPVTFDNWLKQAMGFCFKSIMAFTVVALFAAVIMNFYYRTFGFTTCYNTGFKLELCAGKLGCATISKIPTWTFGQEYKPYNVGVFEKNDLGTKNRSTFTGGVAWIKIPPDYTEEGCRYVDYPFFDPQFTADAKDCHKIDNPDFPDFVSKGKGRDYEIIKKNIQGDDGYFVVSELFAMILLTMLLFHIRVFAERIGASIAGCSPYVAVIGMHLANFLSPQHNNLFTFLPGKLGQAIQGFQVALSPNISSWIGRAVPHSLLAKTSVGQGLLSVGKGISAVYSTTEWMVGAESDITRKFREKEAFKSIHLAQAVIGQTLSDLSPDNLVTAGLTHQYDKMLGVTDQGIGRSALNAYRTQLQRMKDNIYGTTEPEPPKSDQNAKDEDDNNPFQLPGDGKRDVGGTEEFTDNPLYESIDDDPIYQAIDEVGTRSIEDPDNYQLPVDVVGNDFESNLYSEIDEQFSEYGDPGAGGSSPGDSQETPEGPISFGGDTVSMGGTSTNDDNYSDASTAPLGRDQDLGSDSGAQQPEVTHDANIFVESEGNNVFVNPTYDSTAPVGRDQDLGSDSGAQQPEAAHGFGPNESGGYDNHGFLDDEFGNDWVGSSSNDPIGGSQAEGGIEEPTYAQVNKTSSGLETQVDPIPEYTEEQEEQVLAAAAAAAFSVEQEPPELPPRPEPISSAEKIQSQPPGGNERSTAPKQEAKSREAKNSSGSKYKYTPPSEQQTPYDDSGGDNSTHKRDPPKKKKKKNDDGTEDDSWS